METFGTETVVSIFGVVSDASSISVAKVISLAALVDASVATIKISTILFSHAAVIAGNTFVDILASWLAVKRVNA